jgi:hypothetical protein
MVEPDKFALWRVLANRNQKDDQFRLLLSFANGVSNERLPSEQIVNASKTA